MWWIFLIKSKYPCLYCYLTWGKNQNKNNICLVIQFYIDSTRSWVRERRFYLLYIHILLNRTLICPCRFSPCIGLYIFLKVKQKRSTYKLCIVAFDSAGFICTVYDLYLLCSSIGKQKPLVSQVHLHFIQSDSVY